MKVLIHILKNKNIQSLSELELRSVGIPDTLIKTFLMFSLTLIFASATFSCFAQSLNLVTWNIRDFGSRLNDQQLDSIAAIISLSDLCTIQEVVLNEGGDEAADLILERLRIINLAWNYVISDPSDSSPYFSERYLIFWNGDYVTKFGEPWMEFHFKNEVEREPFMCNFDFQGSVFTLATIHAKSSQNQPETDLKYLKLLPSKYLHPLLISGDFNVVPYHTVFNPLKKIGFQIGNDFILTTLKKKINAEEGYGKNAYDNFLIPPIFEITETSLMFSIVNQYDLDYWRGVSDHVPLKIILSMRHK